MGNAVKDLFSKSIAGPHFSRAYSTPTGQGFQGGSKSRNNSTLWRLYRFFEEATRMLLGPMFDNFVERKPYCVMARAALERMLSATRLDA